VIQKTFYTVRKLSDPAPERPPFLVEGIVHESVTLLYGEAKIGKSTLAAALAAAMADGAEEFLGRTVTVPGAKSVGIIAGDFADGVAYIAQLRQVTDSDRIVVYDVNRPPVRQLWQDLQLDVRQAGHDLVIVDNLTSLIPGSVNDDVAVNLFYDELDGMVRESAAVVLVAHSSEKTGEHGKSPYPMGSSAIRSRARRTWRVEPWRGDLRLTFRGNGDGDSELIVTPARGIPHFDVLKVADSDELAERRAKRWRERDSKSREKADRIREFVLAECQGKNGKQTAEAIVKAGFVGTPSTHQTKLSRNAYGVRQIETGVWQSAAEAA
jgi:KaiC/GvpD/RAD55 family RecA-like ATPase